MENETKSPSAEEILSNLSDITEELAIEFISNYTAEELIECAASIKRIETAVALIASAGHEPPYAATQLLKNYQTALSDLQRLLPGIEL